MIVNYEENSLDVFIFDSDIMTLIILRVALPPCRSRIHCSPRNHVSANVSDRYTIRQLKVKDLDQTAALCLEAFGVPDEGFSLTTRPRTQAQWVQQLRSALAGKQLAAVQSRLYRRQSQSHPLRKSQIAALETQRNNKSPKNIMSKPGSYAGAYPRDEQKALPMTNVEKQMLATWRRRRHFVCFVAEEKISEKIVACVAVCLARPEAALPPPFPTRAQQRFYVSNLAVAAPHRRRGVASQLLIQCERLAKAWRHDSIWLQVDNVNEASLSLYEARGYREAEKNMFGFWGSDTRRLLRKDIPLPLSCSQGQLSSSTAIVSGETGPDGVFQWRISHSGDEQQMF